MQLICTSPASSSVAPNMARRLTLYHRPLLSAYALFADWFIVQWVMPMQMLVECLGLASDKMDMKVRSTSLLFVVFLGS